MQSAQKIVLDPFCLKQWDPKAGSLFINYDKDAFTAKVNQYYLDTKDNGGLRGGYAPFCKHLFIPNFTDATSGTIEITPENERFIISQYEARRENELPVLVRYFDKAALEETLGTASKQAQFLDIILYSKA